MTFAYELAYLYIKRRINFFVIEYRKALKAYLNFIYL